MDALDDSQWRVLLETIRLTVLVDDSGVTVNIAVPTVNDEKSVIAEGSSPFYDISLLPICPIPLV